MFKGEFREAHENSATFPEDSADAFELLLEWIYTGKFNSVNPFAEDALLTATIHARIHLYGLAEKICLPELADYTMNMLAAKALFTPQLTPPTAELVRIAYEITTRGSPLRKLISLLLHFYMRDPFESTSARKVSLVLVEGDADVVEDVILHLRDQDQGVNKLKHPRSLPACTFHQHSDHEICHYKKFGLEGEGR